MSDTPGAIQIKVETKPTLDALASKFKGVDIKGSMQDELNKILLRIESYGKQLAPVGTPESTHKKGYVGGKLRASIFTAPISGQIGGMVSTNTDYALYVHDGTRKMRARPFLATALGLVQAGTEEQLGRRLDSEFTKTFKTL